MFDCAVLGGTAKLDEMIEFVKENAPYLLLTKNKIMHWQEFHNELI